MNRIRITSVIFLISAMVVMTGCNWLNGGLNGINQNVNPTIQQGDPNVGPSVELEPAFCALFEINSEDIEKGYYEFFVEFEESDDGETYEVTYPLYVNSIGDYTWNVYVFDYNITAENIEDILAKETPVIINSGEVEVISGQSIYVTLEGVDEGGPGGRLTADYVMGTDYWRNVDVIFKCIEKGYADSYAPYPYPPKWTIDAFKLVDITGDGQDDCCFSKTVGSGLVRTQCIVYDAAEDAIYKLDDPPISYYVKGVEDGKLIVEEEKIGELTGSVIKTMGTVILEDGELVFVAD